jgi:hypothetical protein
MKLITESNVLPNNFTGIVEYSNGDKYWYLNGEYHREDGPAIEYSNGSKEWYLNGKCHRVDGPACEYSKGDKYWYLNGIHYTESEFLKQTKPSCNGKKYKLTLV